jgi:ABC-type transport system substrate-binding protein
MLRSRVLFFLACLLSFSTQPWANGAVKGGAYSLNLGGEPTTLNPLNSTDGYAQDVQKYVLETLAKHNDDTYEWEPSLATSWTISKDGKEFVFKLRQGVTWHDGQPLTAEDVKFSYDVIFDSHYDTAALRPYFEAVEKVEIIDPQTVKFVLKTKYFGNFEQVAGTMWIIPKHIYGDLEKGPKLNHELIGSGPYILDKNEKGKRLVLKRNPTWWGLNVPAFKDQYNFDQLTLKFVAEETVALEMLKKGDLDFNGLDPDSYAEKAVGAEWGKSVLKVKAENVAPKGYLFVGWNLKNPLFMDKKVRLALWHLMNRKLMIEKFRHGMSLPATGPWYLQNDYASKKVKVVEYDTKLAHTLLTEAGWADTDHTGVLSKVIDGKKTDFKFTLLCPSQDYMKYYTLYKEDLKKAGIDMDLKYVEWNSFIKILDERKFDALTLSWTGDVDPDPKQIWSSESIANQGSNFVSYSNPEVDKLIEQARGTMDKKKRIPILQKVYEIIADDAPYAFMFNDKYVLYGVTARTKKPKDTFNYTVGLSHFWLEK